MTDYSVNARPAGIGRFLVGLVQVILNPRQGWLDADKDNYSPRDLLVNGFCPFLAVVALSSLLNALYRSAITLPQAIIEGCIDFTGYFVSVYICNYLLQWCLKKWVSPKKDNENKRTTFVIYSIASMSFITLLNNIFPVDLAILSFLPLYVIYIIWSGRVYMGIPDDRRPQFVACSLGALFFPPYILCYCLSMFL